LSTVLARADSIAALEALLLVASREGDLPALLGYSKERHRKSMALLEDLLALLDRRVPELLDHGAELAPFLLEKDGREHTLRTVLPFIESVPDSLSSRGPFCLAAGMLLRLEGKHAQARLYLEAASQADFPLATHSLYLAMECAAESGELERMLELLKELETSEPPDYLLSKGRVMAGLALVDSRLEGEALAILETASETRVGAGEKVQVAHALGRLYEKSGDYAKAAGSYAAAFNKSAPSEEAFEASRAYLRLVREGKTLTEEAKLLSAAECLTRGGLGLEAQTTLETLYADGRGSLKAGWQLGRLYYRARRYSAAAAVFEKLAKVEKRTADSLRARLWVARCKRQLYRTEEAIELFRQISLAGRHVVSMEAAWELGMELESQGKLHDAAESYDSLHRRFPGTRLGREGLWRRGLCEYRQGLVNKARSTFALLARGRVPSSLHDMAAFWKLKCSVEAGEPLSSEELRRAKPKGDSFYGLLLEKASKSGVVDEQFFRVPLPRGHGKPSAGEVWPLAPLAESGDEIESPQGPPYDEASRERAVEALPGGLPSEVPTAVALLRFGLRGLAREELRLSEKALAGQSQPLFFLAQLYWRNDFYKEALSLADGLLRRGRDLREDQKQFLKRMLYPIYSIEVVLEESRSQGIDPLLVLSVMRRESTFDPEATSPAGATGVMQLMPQTAEEIAAYLGEEDPVDKLRDPELNIRYGVWLLGRLTGKYSESTVAALAAYNAGEYSADRWIDKVGASDGFLYMESVSFRETREYLRRVLGDLHVYTSLYLR